MGRRKRWDCVVYLDPVCQLQLVLSSPCHPHGYFLCYDTCSHLFPPSGATKASEPGVGVRSDLHMFKHRFICSTLSYWKSQRFNRFLWFQFCLHLPVLPAYGHLHFFRTSSSETVEISEKTQKSLITPIRD